MAFCQPHHAIEFESVSIQLDKLHCKTQLHKIIDNKIKLEILVLLLTTKVHFFSTEHTVGQRHSHKLKKKYCKEII